MKSLQTQSSNNPSAPSVAPAVGSWGLVLEGGAMRGLFSAGVIDVLMEHELWPGGVVGVSAGAAFGCNVKSRQPGRVIRYNTRFARDRRYCSVWSIVTTGDIFGGDFCYHYMPRHLDVFDDATFEASPMRFHVVCTDVETGEAVYKELPRLDYDALEWLRASASMPVASKIVRVEGRKLLDGGIADSIPLRYFEGAGYEKNVVVLTQPRGFVKKSPRINRLVALWLRKYPRFVEAARRRHIMYNEELDYVARREAAGSALVIAPREKLPIGHLCHDPEQMRRVYQLGRDEAMRRLDELRMFVGQDRP